MFKHFNFGIFITTLGIVSIVHAIDPNILKMISSQSYKFDYPNTNSNSGMNSPNRQILSTSLQTGSSSVNSNTNQRPFSIDDALKFESEIRRMKNQKPINDITGSVVYKCWTNGQSRIMQKGDSCNGTLQIVNGNTKTTTETTDTSKIPTNNFGTSKISSPSEDNSQITPQTIQRALSKQPYRRTEYDNNDDKDTEKTSQSIDLYQRPNFFGRQAPSSKPLPDRRYDNGLNTLMGQPSESSPIFSNLFGNQYPNSKSSSNVERENSNMPNNWKVVTDKNGVTKSIQYPDEIEVQPHRYEKPIGLSDDQVNEIRKQVLTRTNYYRKKHGLSPLTLNNDINQHAQEWANHMAPTNTIFHRGVNDNNIYGENLYISTSDFGKKIGELCVDAWYQELRFVELDDDDEIYKDNPRGETGHLTALLWKKSREMGVGAAKDNKGQYIIAANYNPGGNVVGFFLDNLPTFEQKDIDAAKDAWDKFAKEHLTEKKKPMFMDPVTGRIFPADGSVPIVYKDNVPYINYNLE